MELSNPAPDPFADALAAAQLLAIDPAGLGGLWLRAPAGDATDAVVDALRAALPAAAPIRIVPASADDERLFGGLDIVASLAAGRTVYRNGLFDEASGGLLIVRGAERMTPAVAGRLSAAVDASGAPPALLLIDHGVGDEVPPASLRERVAFHVTCADATIAATLSPALRPAGEVEPPDQSTLAAIAATAAALGVGSMRACRFTVGAARAAAIRRGITAIGPDELALAGRLVLGPRATQLPASELPPESETEPPPPGQAEQPLEDVVLEAARATVPPDLLAAIDGSAARRSGSGSGNAGQRRRTPLRGRPLGARGGLPGSGRRLAIVDTLRAAAPWQGLRRAPDDGTRRLRLRRDDLRIRRFEDRAEALAVFAVDASGSSARARLAEAKGAVELLLQQAYSKRLEVALVAFRGAAADTLLPPTRSLTRARRLLAELPGGGGTPLAAGIEQARRLADAGRQRGRTPHIVVLTDGRANIAADGSAGRAQAEADALAAAKRLRSDGIRGTIIDIGPRRQPEAAALATAMGARYLHLPRADATAVQAAIDA